MRVTIEKIVYPGKSLAYFKGKTVFTDQGLPGEILEAEPVREKKTIIHARTTKIISPSPYRTTPRCSHYKICSPYQYIDYPVQLKIKKEQVSEFLNRSFKHGTVGIDIRPSPLIWGYRNKAHFHLIRNGRKACPGYHLPGEREKFSAISNCSLLSPEINKFLSYFIEFVSVKNFPWIEEIIIRQSFHSKKLLLALKTQTRPDSKILEKAAAALSGKFPLNGIICRTQTGFNSRDVVAGEDYLEEKIDGTKYFFGAFSFFQINPAILPLLIKDIKEYLDNMPLKGTLADFFCGVGTFGLALSENFKEVTAIECSPENIKFLKKSILSNPAGNFSIYEGTAEKQAARVLRKRPDVIILDPPRNGLKKTFCEYLLKNPCGTIIYISCNPATLFRDIKILRKKYHIEKIRLYDFFPQTPHVETCVILKTTATNKKRACPGLIRTHDSVNTR